MTTESLLDGCCWFSQPRSDEKNNFKTFSNTTVQHHRGTECDPPSNDILWSLFFPLMDEVVIGRRCAKQQNAYS